MADWEDAPAKTTTKDTGGWEDAPAPKAKSPGPIVGSETAALIPTGGERTVPRKGELAGEPSYLEKASMYASAVPATGLAAGALKTASAGTKFAPYAAKLAEAVIPETGAGLAKATAGAAASAIPAEFVRSQLEQRGASPLKQEVGEAVTALSVGGLEAGALKLGSKGYNYVSNLVNRAFGTEARDLANALRSYASNRAGGEAQAAKQLATQAEQRATTAEKTATQQAGRAEQAYAAAPGTKTQKIAGEFTAVPEESQTIGDRIKTYADNVYNQLKNVRNKNAETNKTAAFNAAKEREARDESYRDTQAYKKVDDYIKNEIKNSSVQPIISQLKEVQKALTGRMVDEASGEVVQVPRNFEGLEQLRRFLGDRAYGLPAEGFDAISQQQAGKLAKMVEGIQKEFSPGIETFLNQYKADSEPLRAFQSKVGKALIDQQLAAKEGLNYAKVPAESIPGRVFQNREAYQNLIDAFGGNRAFAENQAQKYFAGEMRKYAGNPDALKKFILDNYSMLKLTNSMPMAEQITQATRTATRRAGTAETVGKEARDVQKAAQINSKEFETLQSNINSAQTNAEVAAQGRILAKKLYSQNTINQKVYEQMNSLANRVEQSAKDVTRARSELIWGTGKLLGAGALGTGAYFGLKSQFGE